VLYRPRTRAITKLIISGSLRKEKFVLIGYASCVFVPSVIKTVAGFHENLQGDLEIESNPYAKPQTLKKWQL
jgi:hypothetical protein